MVDSIVLVRHSKAEGASEATDDLARRLTRSGECSCRFAMARVAPLIEQTADVRKLQVWTSGAVRAHQTAEIAADALGVPSDEIRVVDALTCGDADALLEELASAEGTVVAVGHNPFVERFVRQVSGAEVHFGKAAAACLLPGEKESSYELAWFMQGPHVERWETLVSMEQAFARAGERIETNARGLMDSPEDPEALHQYRVSLRIARSLLAFAKPYLRRAQWSQTNDLLKDLQGQTSKLRELDVMIGELEGGEASGCPDAAKLQSACTRRRVRMRGRFFERFTGEETRGQLRQVTGLLGHVEWRGPVESEGVTEQELRERYLGFAETYLKDLEQCDFADAEATHAIRKRAKMQRYVAREFSAVLGKDCGEVGAQAKSTQTLLGELCDARVNLGLAKRLQKEDGFGQPDEGEAEPAAGDAAEGRSYAEMQQDRIEAILRQLAGEDAEA